MNQTARIRGLLLVITGASFWGVGGTVSQYLFQPYHIEVNWFVATRLLSAGILLLSIQFFLKDWSQIMFIWKSKRNALSLIIFGLFGMLAVQYTYMASINHGNASVAILLQYLAPVMIILYYVIRKQASLTMQDATTVLLVLASCFLLLTNGSIDQLSVPIPQ